jgi:hypothetical protein
VAPLPHCGIRATVGGKVKLTPVYPAQRVACSRRRRYEVDGSLGTARTRPGYAGEAYMTIQLTAPMFEVGEILLGFSVTMFIGAVIATVGYTHSSRRR